MTAETARDTGVDRFARPGMGERLGGFVYGTIVVLAVIVAGAKAYKHSPGHVAALVAVTTIVFWLAHVYAHALAHSVTADEHLSGAELRRIARHEAAIVEAGVPPIVALLLGAIGVLSKTGSLWAALFVGLAVLIADGFLFARAERLGRLATVGVVLGNFTLGLVIVLLKVVVTH
jgi:hypothetical protein